MKKPFAFILTFIIALSLTSALPAMAKNGAKKDQITRSTKATVTQINQLISRLQKKIKNSVQAGTLHKKDAHHLRSEIKKAQADLKSRMKKKESLNEVWDKLQTVRHEFNKMKV